jgi:hypothetical protein
MNKLLITLLASAFALTAYAQTPKSDTAPKAPASAEAKKAQKKPAKAKSEKKAKAKAKAGEKKAATK